MRVSVLLALALLSQAAPLQAQIDWHAPRQAGRVWERKIDENNLEASRRSAEQRAQAAAADAAWDAPLSAADLEATRARNRAEYERRLRLGEGFAENWLDRTARLERLERQEKGAPALASGEARPAGQEGREPATGAPDPAAQLAFGRSAALTAQVEAMVADNLSDNFSLPFALADPPGFVRSGQARAVYQQALAARGYSGDSLADATALMFGVAWELANGRELSPAQQAAILSQAAAKLGADWPAQRSDEERQTQADSALLIAALWLEEARLREGQPHRLSELSDAVNRNMRQLSGIDMRAHEVSAVGIVER